MSDSIAFFLGLLDREESPCVSIEDFDGPHGPMLKDAQQLGLIAQEPGMNPIASCPHCEDGIPVSLGEKLLCGRCLSIVDPHSLLLWEVDVRAFLAWVGAQWQLRGGIQQLGTSLWQLGTLKTAEGIYECFYRRPGLMSDATRSRLAAYRQSVVLFGLHPPASAETIGPKQLSLLELLRTGPPLAIADPLFLGQPDSIVRFDKASGGLWAGKSLFGEVPVGSKEYFFLDCLAGNLDRFVSYADLKQEIHRRAGSSDSRDEATFCHRLKSAIKKNCIPEIDRFVVTTNKADGYRMRSQGKAQATSHEMTYTKRITRHSEERGFWTHASQGLEKRGEEMVFKLV